MREFWIQKIRILIEKLFLKNLNGGESGYLELGEILNFIIFSIAQDMTMSGVRV